MFGSFLPSALGWLVATKVYSGTGADIVMESITRFDCWSLSATTNNTQTERHDPPRLVMDHFQYGSPYERFIQAILRLVTQFSWDGAFRESGQLPPKE